MGSQKFLMKAVTEVEAIRYMPGNNCNCAEVAEFQGLDEDDIWTADCLSGLCGGVEWTIETPTGNGEADLMPGDWLVKNDGHFYCFTNSEFEASFNLKPND